MSTDPKPHHAHSGHDEHDALAARARALFEEASAHIDAATLRRLDQARRAAATPAVRRHRLLPVLVPAGALAAAALAFAVIWHPLRRAPPADVTVSGTVGLVAGADSHEMEMAQNLDFYDWLASQPAPAGAASAQ